MTLLHRLSGVAAVLLTLALPPAVLAQGKSQEPHGKGNGGGNGASPSKPTTPNQSVLPTAASIAGPSDTVSPFAWLDNASLLPPGAVWFGMSTARWSGTGASEVSLPAVDVAAGVTSRVQIGASLSRVVDSSDPAGPAGGLGTAFLNAKIAVLHDSTHGLNIAVAPTLEILSQAAMQAASSDQSRAQWGLPVSIDVERGFGRFFGSAGHFTSGVWFAGAGAGRRLSKRVDLSGSFSHAWTSSPSTDPGIVTPSRNDLSIGMFVDVLSQLGVFGSIGRTIATKEQDGAGTTFSIGISWTARHHLF